jgi:hypothetical protein
LNILASQKANFMIPTLPTRLDWPSTMGLFIINFGMLDYLVFAFLEKHLRPEEFSKSKSVGFKDRLNRIKRNISEGDFSAETKDSFKNFFNRLEPVRDLRNHIAHGHMLTRLNPDTKDFTMTLSLPKNLDAPYSPESRHLEYPELGSKLGELTALIEEFQKLMVTAGKTVRREPTGEPAEKFVERTGKGIKS